MTRQAVARTGVGPVLLDDGDAIRLDDVNRFYRAAIDALRVGFAYKPFVGGATNAAVGKANQDAGFQPTDGASLLVDDQIEILDEYGAVGKGPRAGGGETDLG